MHSEVVDGDGGHETDSNEHMVMHPDNNFYQSDLFSPIKRLRSIGSSSSSLSVSLEDLFQVDTQPASKDASSSPTSACQGSHESPTQFPPTQVMDRSDSGGYDPLRIPSSVFESESTTLHDWSAASNESLFSIHIGNNSFSRELMLGSDLFKSGEYTKSSELLIYSPSPPASGMETDKKGAENGGATGESVERFKDKKTRATAENQSKEKSSHSYSSSDESVTSSHSFAFPILTDGLKSGSVNGDDEKQQSLASEVNSNLTDCNWFRCFSPWPSCCFHFCPCSCRCCCC